MKRPRALGKIVTCDGCESTIDLTSDDRWYSLEYGALQYEGEQVVSGVRTAAFVCESCFDDGRWSREVLIPKSSALHS